MIYRRIKKYDPDSVTSRNPDEVDPRSVGLDPTIVDQVWGATVRHYRARTHPAIAVCVRYRGEVILDRAIGHLHGNSPGEACDNPVPIRHDSLFNFFSGSKAVTAMLIHHLDDEGLVHIDDCISDYIPEFTGDGREEATIRHILNHRACVPRIDLETDLDVLNDHERMLSLMQQIPVAHKPGRKLAYHAVTGGFILGEIVLRVTGKDIKTYLEDTMLKPLSFRSLNYGIEPERLHEVAKDAYTGISEFPPFSTMLRKGLGADLKGVVRLATDERLLTGVVPSGNVVASANDVSRFFELLRCGGELDGVRVFRERTVRRAVREQSFMEFDRTIGLPIRYGLGFMLGSEHFSFYGPHTTQAFGHLGFSNILGWADPEREISVAYMNSGKPFISPDSLLWLSVPRLISKTFPRQH